MTYRDRNKKIDLEAGLPDLRGQVILSAIINEHLVTGEPVGSKLLAEKFANATGMSSATIRNVMGDLEEKGLLEQPHTSAGRVPTDQGYRFYVDNLLGVLSMNNDDLRIIRDEFGLTDSELVDSPDRLMERTSQILSVLSNNVGIVISPSLADDVLQHIEFVNLSDNRILVILVSNPNTVHNKIIRIRENFSKDELDRTARYLNTEFVGKSLSQIRSDILRLMHEEKALFDRLLQTAMLLCSESIEAAEGNQSDIFVDGTENIVSMRDFRDIDRMKEILGTIAEKSRLMQILNQCIVFDKKASDGVKVLIGNEINSDSLKDCTLISAPYRIGDGSAVGTLTVLGPTRIEYARMISIVTYVARILETVMARELSK